LAAQSERRTTVHQAERQRLQKAPATETKALTTAANMTEKLIERLERENALVQQTTLPTE
jgi:hypothetical protein